MDKNKDLDLLELQNLVQKYKCNKSRKSEEEIGMIVRAHVLNHVPVSEISKIYRVHRVTVYRWIRTFADGIVSADKFAGVSNVKSRSPTMPKKIQKPVETETEELARLREENQRLSEALKTAEWMNHAKDVMIDEAEKMFNIPIRKKSGAKQ